MWKTGIENCGGNQDCKRRVVKEAIACLKSLEISDDCCIGYLVEFIRTWNKARGYDLQFPLELIKRVMNFIKSGNDINSLDPEIFKFEKIDEGTSDTRKNLSSL